MTKGQKTSCVVQLRNQVLNLKSSAIFDTFIFCFTLSNGAQLLALCLINSDFKVGICQGQKRTAISAKLSVSFSSRKFGHT